MSIPIPCSQKSKCICMVDKCLIYKYIMNILLIPKHCTVSYSTTVVNTVTGICLSQLLSTVQEERKSVLNPSNDTELKCLY